MMLATLVLEMAVLTVVGLLVGAAIDRHFGTSPLFLAVLLLASFASGVIRLVRAVSTLTDPDARSKKDPS
jgi:F0F1-type ATP synthase assembly protein I